ncbi:MAG: D-2-hydroxyacid dehydrogenase [Candidatus Korobacteraceae bacterium]
MKLLIALHHRFPLWQVPPWFSERLRRDFPQLEVVHLPNYDHVMEEIADADIAIAWSLRGEQIKAAKRLRWIHSTAAAVHHLMTPELLASDIVVTNARDVHGPVVAEHAIGLAFALAKRLPQSVRYQQQKRWAQHDLWAQRPRLRELNSATMTIVGLGAIGAPLARLAKCLGMRVVGVREHPERGSEVADTVHGFEELDAALSAGDFIVLAVPVTPKTRHLMNAERLARLKPDAYLINVGRGVLLDEAALVDALRAKSFGGAALDVTTEEPLPPESPL